ncbi:PQQ-dependent sugar dehydrogenase [Winogradskyella sp. 3972H.M.0a.05]|uniref:PQQ-dependent sugar dehydrogenase n=1 Tax=Winogradskyella sp. 3972H.M.0a.05 TaxID=2950277 RepID=UPI00339AF55D
MTITALGDVSSPSNEEVDLIIDGSVSTKFLDFEYNDGMGFTVDLGGSKRIASSITITTANDVPNRDPQNFTIYGSNNGIDFAEIVTDAIPCVSARFNERTFDFTNTVAYAYYRINFETQCGSANSIQLSEVQLYSTLPTGYSAGLVQSGYTDIMGVIFNDTGTKMFVWEKRGHIYVSNWDGSEYVKQAQPILDISDEVGDWRDFGFSSFCLDPDFDTNGLIYMFYMVDREHLMDYGTPDYDPNDNDYFEASISRVTRYQVDLASNPLTVDYNSRFVLLGESVSTGIPLLHESHAGGTILFGTDGTLLISTGDNASYLTEDTGGVGHTYYDQAIDDGILRDEENVGAFRSQMITSMCGKVLRIDPITGDGLPSNPHYNSDNPRSAESRMWAMGLRNPFRMSIEPNSGSTNPDDGNPGILHVSDVGWNVWEDLHIFDKAGLNGGWPLFEGLTVNNGYYDSNTTNPDEGNVLFKDNCLQPTSFTDNADPSLRRFVHDRPEIAWRHGGANHTRVPWFNGSAPTDPRVGSAGAPTTGIEFNGNAAAGGVFITGNALGSSMTGKYFFTDYTRSWIQVATLTDGTQNWVSHISNLAPTGFGSGIVHINQNPLDGFVYYVNIFDGTVHKISFVGPEWIEEPMDLIVECDGSSNLEALLADWLSLPDGTVTCGMPTITNNSDGNIECGETKIVTFTLLDECGNHIEKTVSFTADETLSTSNNTLEAIKIYPNPTRDSFMLSGIQDKLELRLFSLKGELLLMKQVENNTKIPLQLSSGIYIIQINSDREVETRRIIIK